MKQIFVTPKESFKIDGISLLSEIDGGVQLLGYLNDEKGTVDFPAGRLSPKAFSIPQDKFVETDEMNTLRAKVKEFEAQKNQSN